MPDVAPSGTGNGSAERPAFVSRVAPVAIWVALGIAVWPVLRGWLRQIVASPPFDAHVVLAPLLLALLLHRRTDRPPRRRGPGALLLGAGLGAAMLGLLADASSVSRLGVVAAITGLGLVLGRLTAHEGALLLGAVPIPYFVVNAATPQLESAYAAAAAALLGPVSSLSASGPLLHAEDGVLELVPQDSGLRLAAVGWVVAWWDALARGVTGWRAIGRSASGAAIGLALQLPGILVATVLLVLGTPGAAAGWLSTGLWVVVAVAGVAGSRRDRARLEAP